MILTRKPPTSPPAPSRLEVQSPTPEVSGGPRAPLAQRRLDEAIAALAALDEQVAALALAQVEGDADAEAAIIEHRAAIEAVERNVSELRRAVTLATRLDRERDAASAVRMRANQLAAFKAEFTEREKAMAEVLDAAAEMAAAYGRYSEATLRALAAVPAGTVVPQMAIGAEGFAGPAFGTCERLVLAEIWRFAPNRSDGIGRLVLPFAKPSSEFLRGKPGDIRPGIDELRAADEAIIADIGRQIEMLNAQSARTAQVEAADRSAA